MSKLTKEEKLQKELLSTFQNLVPQFQPHATRALRDLYRRYWENIEYPMSFDCIRGKVKSFQYNDITELEADVKLIVENN